jgi:hypothetical protein
MAEQVPDDQALLAKSRLNFAEAAMLCEALRSLWLSPEFAARIWLDLGELMRSERLDKKRGTNSDVLVNRLGRLGRAEATALLRAAIRFWERREEPTAKSLRDLGLIRARRHRVSLGTKKLAKQQRGTQRPSA